MAPVITEKLDQLTTENQETCGKIQMRKEIGLLEGVAIILGIILGSGKLCYSSWFVDEDH